MTIHKSYIEQKACRNCKHVFKLFDYDMDDEYYCYFEKEKPDYNPRVSKVAVDADLEVEDVGFCQRYKMDPDAFSDATKAKNSIIGADDDAFKPAEETHDNSSWPFLKLCDERPQKGFWAPGYYQRKCITCGNMFMGDKRALDCAECAYKEAE
jgi:hypothetical protein